MVARQGTTSTNTCEAGRRLELGFRLSRMKSDEREAAYASLLHSGLESKIGSAQPPNRRSIGPTLIVVQNASALVCPRAIQIDWSILFQYLSRLSMRNT